MNIISILDFGEDLNRIIDMGIELKKKKTIDNSLRGRTLAMIFEKASTRTRVSFEVAMNQLGGRAMYMSPREMQLGRGETIADTARVLSRYVDAVLIRAKRHEDVIEFAKYSSVPVINGLTDREHPCQVLSDLMTIKEIKGNFNTTLAYVGDGNNVCHSLILGCAMAGVNIRVATPPGYEPLPHIVEKAKSIAKSEVTITNEVEKAVRGAEFIYTDVWASMGHEHEREKRLRDFRGYQVNSELLKLAPDARVMHCLPARRGEEITDEVIDGNASIVFDQAENRLHAQKAILKWIFDSF